MNNDSLHDVSEIGKKKRSSGETCRTLSCPLTIRTMCFFFPFFGETIFYKSSELWGWHLYRCGKARSNPVIKALTQGEKKEKVLSSVIFWQGSERRAKQYSYMLGSSWKKNDCMFDCLIARLYLRAIVLGDSDQSCVHIICLLGGCTVHVCNLFL